jgi:DNA-binding MarR family transcriptional regulator
VPVQDVDAGAHTIISTLDRLYRLLRRILPPDNLSLTAASTLKRLESGDTLRLTDLSVLEGITQPAMTQLISRLEKENLAERVKHASDGRVVLIRITEAGRQALSARRDIRAQRLGELLAALPDADREAILAALPALDRLYEIGNAAS